MAIIPALAVPLMVMAGFLVNQNNIPYFFYEFEYLSPFKYCFQAGLIVKWNISVFSQLKISLERILG